MPTDTPLIALILTTAAAFLAGMSVYWILGPAWDRVAVQQVRDLSPQMQDLRLDTRRLPLYLRIWGLLMMGTLLVIGFIAGMIPVAIALVYLIYVFPRYLMAYLIQRRRTMLRDQMVAASVGLANAVRAGLSLAHGIEAVCEDTPEPLATELRQIVAQWQRGRPLLEAIDDVRLRLRLDGFTLFALAISACIERGGNVSDALERISRSLSENQRLERKLEADTASGKRVVTILSIFPIIFMGMFYVLDPDSTIKLFSTISGQFMLVIVIAIVYISAHWCSRILNIEV